MSSFLVIDKVIMFAVHIATLSSLIRPLEDRVFLAIVFIRCMVSVYTVLMA